MPSRLFKAHRILKGKLFSLGIKSYAAAEEFARTPEKDLPRERIEIDQAVYELSYFVGVYPPENEIVVAAYLTRKRFLCGEGFSAGISYKQEGAIKYFSQKQLWEFGF